MESQRPESFHSTNDEHPIINDHSNIDELPNSKSDSSSVRSETSHDIKQFHPEPMAEDEENNTGLQRQPSVLKRISSRVSFFNTSLLSHRKKLVRSFLTIYVMMAISILGIFSIYWGSYYQRSSRLPNLKMLVVIEDVEVPGQAPPVIGDTIREIVQSPKAKSIGGWDIQNSTVFKQEAEANGNTVEEEVTMRIHHQLYWASIYVRESASENYRQYIEENNSDVNITTLIDSIYETGRDFLNMRSYVMPQIEAIEKMWLSKQSQVTKVLTSDSYSMDQVQKLNQPLTFNYVDKIPFQDPVLVAPSQVGLIYIIIITFFQVNMFGDIHQQVGKLKLKHTHYVLYRLLSSYVSYFVLSLFYSLVTLAFQVDLTKAFGKSGFLVYWMLSYITMIAVGIINEFMALVLFLVFPPLIGFWLLFWVLVNISPTFAPIALVPKFYRFGYAMPIHNSYELTKVIFFDTYKGQMGRNIGILFAWIVIGSVAFCVLLKPFLRIAMQRGMKAKQAEAEASAAGAAAAEKDN